MLREATTTKQRMTDADIAATVHRHNPILHGRRDNLRRLRDAMAATATPLELAAIDAELTLWEERVRRYEAGNTW